MKITKNYLKKLIMEEIQSMANENVDTMEEAAPVEEAAPLKEGLDTEILRELEEHTRLLKKIAGESEDMEDMEGPEEPMAPEAEEEERL